MNKEINILKHIEEIIMSDKPNALKLYDVKLSIKELLEEFVPNKKIIIDKK
jgi:hypothetical protein